MGQVVAGEEEHAETAVATGFVWDLCAGLVSPSSTSEAELPAGASVGDLSLAAPGGEAIAPSCEKLEPCEFTTLCHTWTTS